jgi:transposase-like protein
MDGEQAAAGAERVHESAVRRRRKWSAGEKAKIVREAQRPGALLQDVAQRHGLHPSLLTRWRAQGRVVKKVARREARLLPVTVERRPRSESGLVQTALNDNPFPGRIYVFRGRRGDRLKLL